jgi:hypothetical protein
MNPLQTPIQIGGHIIKTEYEGALQDRPKTVGLFCPQTDTISIRPDMPDLYKTQTWLHELNEAINYIWLADKMAHENIEAHSQALLQILPQMGVEITWT